MQACYGALNRCFCWFASSVSALIRLSYSSNGAACALNTFASLALAPICTTNFLFGALHSYWPPQAAHHQLQCFFLSVVAIAVSRRHPPYAATEREAAAMRADTGQGHASHTRHRRDNPPQEVGLLLPLTLYSFVDFIERHLLISSLAQALFRVKYTHIPNLPL